MSWKTLEDQQPDLAAFGKARLHNNVAYLATIRKDGSPACILSHRLLVKVTSLLSWNPLHRKDMIFATMGDLRFIVRYRIRAVRVASFLFRAKQNSSKTLNYAHWQLRLHRISPRNDMSFLN